MAMISGELGAWREAGLPPARDPLATVEQAVASPFAAWWAALPDA